jgi:YfiH family protein
MPERKEAGWIVPDWPVPAHVRSAITTRQGGVSVAPYDSFNLADHVGDAPDAVRSNREQLHGELGLPSEPQWLEQVHGCEVAEVADQATVCRADAATATEPGRVCAVLTADCLPLLLCNRSGSRVAAVHAGWRGLVAGVIESTLARFEDDPSELLVWLGPAIGPEVFEVGPEVREAFVAAHPADEACFMANRPGHWLADIYQLARNRLQRAGAGYVGGGDYCTVSEPERFFSYRRDGVTGRMASLIWITNR